MYKKHTYIHTFYVYKKHNVSVNKKIKYTARLSLNIKDILILVEAFLILITYFKLYSEII